MFSSNCRQKSLFANLLHATMKVNIFNKMYDLCLSLKSTPFYLQSTIKLYALYLVYNIERLLFLHHKLLSFPVSLPDFIKINIYKLSIIWPSNLFSTFYIEVSDRCVFVYNSDYIDWWLNSKLNNFLWLYRKHSMNF